MKRNTFFISLTLTAALGGAALAQTSDFSQAAWARSLGAPVSVAGVPRPARAEAAIPSRSGLPEGFDREKARELARIARQNNLGYFNSQCYAYEAGFMEAAGVIRPGQWSDLGIGTDSAADFAEWAEANPVSLRRSLGLARMENPESVAELPVGGIVVYGRGTCGFSPKHGHIEVVVAENKLCSDGCESFEAACLKDPGVHIYVPVSR
jgi:hypothetical protein